MSPGGRFFELTFDQEYFINDVQPGRGETYALDEEIEIPVRLTTFDAAHLAARIEDSFKLIIKGSGEPLSVYCDYSQLELATTQGALTYDIPNPSRKPGTRVELDFTSALTTDNSNVSEMCMGLTTTSLDFKLPNNDIWTVWKEGELHDENKNSGFWIYDAQDASGAMVKKIKIAITQEDFIEKGQTNFPTTHQ
jgi:hypothetical protein